MFLVVVQKQHQYVTGHAGVWAVSMLKIEKMMICYSSAESVVLSTMCLDVWLHESKKNAEIPRYEVLWPHIDADGDSSSPATTVFRWSTDSVHLSYRCLFGFADHLHIIVITCYTRGIILTVAYDRTLQNGRSMLSYRDRAAAGQNEILHHQVWVSFECIFWPLSFSFSFIFIAVIFIFISFSFCVPPIAVSSVLVSVI